MASTNKKKILIRFLKGCAVATIIYLIVSVLATKLVYDTVFQRYDASPEEISYAAGYAGYDTRETYSYSCGENTLSGYLYKSTAGCKKLVVIVPGFHAETEHYEGIIQGFTDSGFDVFAFDATGHGESEGESSVGFPQIISDLNATLDFIDKNKDFAYRDIFLFGHSRGGYGACCVVNEHPGISAVISVNGVDTAMDGIMAYSTDYIGNIAYGNYHFLWLYQYALFGSAVADRSAVAEISSSDVPVLVIQAANDEQLSEGGFSLYSHKDEVSSDKASFVLYNSSEKDGHTSILYDENGIANMEIIEQATEFFNSNVR